MNNQYKIPNVDNIILNIINYKLEGYDINMVLDVLYMLDYNILLKDDIEGLKILDFICDNGIYEQRIGKFVDDKVIDIFYDKYKDKLERFANDSIQLVMYKDRKKNVINNFVYHLAVDIIKYIPTWFRY